MRRFINRIIDRIQRKRAIKNHRKMWHWLAENPTKGKLDYLLKYGGPKFNSCYLCDYARHAAIRAGWDLGSEGTLCHFCPLDWNGDLCVHDDSLFKRWHLEGFGMFIDEQKKTELALQIAELPEKVKK